MSRPSGSVFGPALLLGAGLGGFLDGIMLHQILRWHHLLSERQDAGQTANLVADGLFHTAAWLAVLAGVLWLWHRTGRGVPETGHHRAGQRRWGALAGPMVAGWGLFNLGEGAVNHHLLGLHHVRPGPDQTLYDIGFLALGALWVAGGLAWQRAASRSESPMDAGAA